MESTTADSPHKLRGHIFLLGDFADIGYYWIPGFAMNSAGGMSVAKRAVKSDIPRALTRRRQHYAACRHRRRIRGQEIVRGAQ